MGTIQDISAVGHAELPASGGPILFTDYVMDVEEHIVFKPQGDFRTLIVRNIGGSDGRFTLEAPEEPSFTLGERVLLFLSKDTGRLFALEDEVFTVDGAFQGKYTIVSVDGVELALRRYDTSGRELGKLRSEILDSYRAGSDNPETGKAPAGPGQPTPA